MTTPVDAASVLLLRPGAAPFEVYMLHRHTGHKFMADVWVFPGGKVDDADRLSSLEGLADGFGADDACARLGADLDPADAVGFHIAAVRETFEEAGILLARPRDDASRLEPDRLQQLRGAVDDGELTIAGMVRDHDLHLLLDELVFFSHWITPEFETYRYDTRFFAVQAPVGQTAQHDDGETTNGAWLTPTEAIDRYRDGDIELAPPTLRILQRLSAFDSVDAALEQFAAAGPPPTIEPELDRQPDEPALVLGDDPDALPGGVARMVMRDGQWFSVCP